jgi:two-component system nitrate/nitrite response regulator NarL
VARVLLADSQRLFTEALEALFLQDGAHAVVGRSSSADEAISLVRRLQPDLALVHADLAMEGSPPLAARMLEEYPEMRILVLGDDQDLELLLAVTRAGAVGVVSKTHGADTVLRAVRAALDSEAVIPRRMMLRLVHRFVNQNGGGNSPLAKLSPREREVLALLRRGWDNTQIGAELSISPHTARTHIQNILEKLGMHSKLEVAAYAMQLPIDFIVLPSPGLTASASPATVRTAR